MVAATVPHQSAGEQSEVEIVIGHQFGVCCVFEVLKLYAGDPPNCTQLPHLDRSCSPSLLIFLATNYMF